MTTWRAVLPLLIVALAGCGLGGNRHPTRFYVLTALAEGGAETGARAPAAGGAGRGLAVAVGPVEIPPHLDRPQIVVWTAASEVRVSEFHRWAEPLAENVARVLADDLAVLVPTDRAVAFPWRGPLPIDYQVPIAISRLEIDARGRVTLAARWSLVRARGRTLVLTRHSTFHETVPAEDYEAAVSAASRTLAALGREIAAALRDQGAPAP